MHLNLLIEYNNDIPRNEPVHVKDLGDDLYQISYSPGFVIGIAKGDIIKIINSDGAFEIIERGSNLAIQLFSYNPIRHIIPEMESLLKTIDGEVDGSIEKAFVCTVPVQSGFQKIENIMNEFVKKHDGIEWFYGNVYDSKDGITPLNWWLDK